MAAYGRPPRRHSRMHAKAAMPATTAVAARRLLVRGLCTAAMTARCHSGGCGSSEMAVYRCLHTPSPARVSKRTDLCSVSHYLFSTWRQHKISDTACVGLPVPTPAKAKQARPCAISIRGEARHRITSWSGTGSQG